MYYCIVKERKGMSTAPPARGVCGITAVAGPCVALVFIETVKLSNVLGEANSLENAHVLAAGENVSAVDIIVYSDNALCNELFFVQLGGSYFSGQRVNEVSPDKRLVGDSGYLLSGDTAEVDDVKMTVKEALSLFSCLVGVVEYVECVVILVLGIDSVSCKTAAQTV